MASRVLFLRAVNVGGATLPMAGLRALATELGARDVSTYIASGNLLCSPPGDADEFDRALESAVETKYGFFREVISRTPEQLRDALEAHPFEVVEDRFSYVYFLTGTPEEPAVRAFEARVQRSEFGADEARVLGSDLHIRYAAGAGRSNLDARTIARELGVQGTGRNLATVRRVIGLGAGE
nr:DUF1697 domain-containing protein [Mycolicibacterium palauense]